MKKENKVYVIMKRNKKTGLVRVANDLCQAAHTNKRDAICEAHSANCAEKAWAEYVDSPVRYSYHVANFVCERKEIT